MALRDLSERPKPDYDVVREVRRQYGYTTVTGGVLCRRILCTDRTGKGIAVQCGLCAERSHDDQEGEIYGGNCKEAIANISGIIIATLINSSKPASPFAASLAGSAVEGIVNGIDVTKKQTPVQNLNHSMKKAVKKALDEVRGLCPFEISADCENAIIDSVFSVDNAIHYMEAPDKEKVFEETIIHTITMYSECDITTILIKQIVSGILSHMETELMNNSQSLTLYNYKISKETYNMLREVKSILADSREFSFDKQKIRECSARLLREYQLSVRFSYYNQRIELSIVPQIETHEGSIIRFSELISWLNDRNINRVQLIGEGGTGKTSFLLSLWNYLITDNLCADYLVNMVSLNRISRKSREEADKFLLIEFAKRFLIDETYLTENKLNYMIKMLSMAEYQLNECRFVLLLDGFNEVQAKYRTTLIEQIKEFDKYKNVIIILTSRFMLRPQHLIYDFFPVYISELNKDTILDDSVLVMVIIRQTRKLRAKT